jgi:hypothetical protein
MDVPSCRGNYSNTDCLELDYKKFVGRVSVVVLFEEKSAARINSPLLTPPGLLKRYEDSINIRGYGFRMRTIKKSWVRLVCRSENHEKSVEGHVVASSGRCKKSYLQN